MVRERTELPLLLLSNDESIIFSIMDFHPLFNVSSLEYTDAEKFDGIILCEEKKDF